MSEAEFRIEPAKPQKPDIFAGILSYLIPGLGQLSQGRVFKGLLFLLCLEGMFFYGLWLGHWQNVYMTSKESSGRPDRGGFGGAVAHIKERPHFAGQFFIGMAAWPAIYQYHNYDKTQDQGPRFGKFQREPTDERINEFQRDDHDRLWDLAWVYTLIAGVLNVLVIYDAVAGPAFRVVPVEKRKLEEVVKNDSNHPPVPPPVPIENVIRVVPVGGASL